ncbi:AAA family ATPase [Rhizobium sp. X9]|uniref:AAA family ATPase n=1 Tax=Rhizobium sp. X9 TaxID=2815360 RepID=UPI001C0AFC23|nr:AAA family ATPase [Rhizobium sp. X9]
MRFNIIPRQAVVPRVGLNEAYLRIDHWNDYSFVTLFEMEVFDETGALHKLGGIKIGFIGQTIKLASFQGLPEQFPALGEGWFSLGQDVEFYRILSENTSAAFRTEFLAALRDVVALPDEFDRAKEEEVFKISFLRSLSVATIQNQFRRVLHGGAPLTDYDFAFMRAEDNSIGAVDIRFTVKANSKPSTNVHAIIGRNGVGKTTLLNNMIGAIIGPPNSQSGFYIPNPFFQKTAIANDYFSCLISVSFSAFDPFEPPDERSDPTLGTPYYYIGLKDKRDSRGRRPLKSTEALQMECVENVNSCFENERKRMRWLAAIETLESDENFARLELRSLAKLVAEARQHQTSLLVRSMSSGHAVVLLTISRLVAKVEEKTLVLLDEPESHLHPPLLSAFTRALGELLSDRNGVAIVATHSPVVLQEIPRSCALTITRSQSSISVTNPTVETFGENVGVLTREVFGLEVTKSGFHTVLEREANSGKSYDAIVAEYGGQLGLEARGILKALVADFNDRSYPA